MTVERTIFVCDLGTKPDLSAAQAEVDRCMSAASFAGYLVESIEVIPGIRDDGVVAMPLDDLTLIGSHASLYEWIGVMQSKIVLIRSTPDQAASFTFAEVVNQSGGSTPSIRSVAWLTVSLGGVPSSVLALLFSDGNPPGGTDLPAITQGEWHINSITGSDTNDGRTALTALKTWASFESRIGSGTLLVGAFSNQISPISRVLVFIHEDLPASDPVDLNVKLPPDFLFGIIGVAKTVRTGTFTTVFPIVQSGNQPWGVADVVTPFSQITDSIAGRSVRVTSGPNANQYAFVADDAGGGVVRMSAFADADLPVPGAEDNLILIGITQGIVAVTDPYAVEDAIKVFIRAIHADGALSGASTASILGFANLCFQNFGGFLQSQGVGYTGTATQVYKRCSWDGLYTAGPDPVRPRAINCQWITNSPFGRAMALNRSGIDASAGLCIGSLASRGATVALNTDFMIQARGTLGFEGVLSGVIFAGVCVFDSIGDGIAFGDGPTTGLNIPCSGISYGQIWGGGNGPAGLAVYAGCHLTVYVAPTIATTAGADFSVGNLTKVWPWDVAAGAFSPISQNTTWANFVAAIGAGGFDQNAHHPGMNASIVLQP